MPDQSRDEKEKGSGRKVIERGAVYDLQKIVSGVFGINRLSIESLIRGGNESPGNAPHPYTFVFPSQEIDNLLPDPKQRSALRRTLGALGVQRREGHGLDRDTDKERFKTVLTEFATKSPVEVYEDKAIRKQAIENALKKEREPVVEMIAARMLQKHGTAIFDYDEATAKNQIISLIGNSGLDALDVLDIIRRIDQALLIGAGSDIAQPALGILRGEVCKDTISMVLKRNREHIEAVCQEADQWRALEGRRQLR